MPDRDVVLAKVAAIQKGPRRIKEVTGLFPERLDDLDVQDIFVFNLQRAIQSAIDLAAHIVASKAWASRIPSGAISYYWKTPRLLTKPYLKRCNR